MPAPTLRLNARLPRITRCASTVMMVLVCVLIARSSVDLHGQLKAEPQPEAPKWALTGNLLQLMRGVYLPTANMISMCRHMIPRRKACQCLLVASIGCSGAEVSIQDGKMWTTRQPCYQRSLHCCLSQVGFARTEDAFRSKGPIG